MSPWSLSFTEKIDGCPSHREPSERLPLQVTRSEREKSQHKVLVVACERKNFRWTFLAFETKNL